MDLLINVLPKVFEANELPQTKDELIDLLIKYIDDSDLEVCRDFIYDTDRRGNSKSPIDLVVFGDEPPLSEREAEDPRSCIEESCQITYGPSLSGYDEDLDEFLDSISCLDDFFDSYGRTTDVNPCALFISTSKNKVDTLAQEVENNKSLPLGMRDVLDYSTPKGQGVYIFICEVL